MERLQKLLSAAGVCSRREAERLIEAGRVAVDGVTATLGESADPDTQVITLDGREIRRAEELVYIMLNKPRGVVTTMSDDRGRTTVADLTRELGVRVYPVGRLDYDSEGLLLMTNDGELANMIMHPSGGITKTYRTWVTGDIAPALEALRGDITIDGVSVRAKSVEPAKISETRGVLLITIGEGRNREVRKMCAACGLRVTRLLRIKEGPLELGGVMPGTYRHLTTHEVASLRRAAGMK